MKGIAWSPNSLMMELVGCGILYLTLLFCAVSLCLARDSFAQNPSSQPGAEQRTVLFFGDSLTAGYLVAEKESYPRKIQELIAQQQLPYQVVNAGVSGETSAAGLRRINWVLYKKPDIFVLALGANDMLRGIPIDETKKNLQGIIDRVKARYPEVRILIAGMKALPNIGEPYTSGYATMYHQLASENRAWLIPFLLEGVAGVPELNLPDRIHPTAAGYDRVAENVWFVLEKLL